MSVPNTEKQEDFMAVSAKGKKREFMPVPNIEKNKVPSQLYQQRKIVPNNIYYLFIFLNQRILYPKVNCIITKHIILCFTEKIKDRIFWILYEITLKWVSNCENNF